MTQQFHFWVYTQESKRHIHISQFKFSMMPVSGSQHVLWSRAQALGRNGQHFHRRFLTNQLMTSDTFINILLFTILSETQSSAPQDYL